MDSVPDTFELFKHLSRATSTFDFFLEIFVTYNSNGDDANDSNSINEKNVSNGAWNTV